jgi:hypothetical protein
MKSRISDCRPLLESGLHEKTLAEIRSLAVEPFKLSHTRQEIWYGLNRFLDTIIEAGIEGEVVLDGSFLTEEIDPEDVDLALCVTLEFYDAANEAQIRVLDWVRDDFGIKESHLCDAYLCIEFPKDHRDYFEGIQDRGWWIDFYAKSVVVKRVRGVALIHLEAAQ